MLTIPVRVWIFLLGRARACDGTIPFTPYLPDDFRRWRDMKEITSTQRRILQVTKGYVIEYPERDYSTAICLM